LKLRIILPLGQTVRLGDIVGVNKDGSFSLEGSSASILGPGLLLQRDPNPKGSLYATASSSTKVEFRAAGSASSTFPNIPNANAGFDISFDSANEWVIALVGQSLQSLEEINQLRRHILDSYTSGIWEPHWALITSIIRADKMTFLASQSGNTKVALSLSAPVNGPAPIEFNLTAGATIVATTNRITQYISSETTTVFCTAIRVKDPWWSPGGPQTSDLEFVRAERDPLKVPDEEFWLDVE
jgi:hypothetical protein